MKVGDTVPILMGGCMYIIHIEKARLPGNSFGRIPTLNEPCFEYYDGALGEHLVVLYDDLEAERLDPFDVYMLFTADYIKEPRWFFGKCAIAYV